MAVAINVFNTILDIKRLRGKKTRLVRKHGAWSLDDVMRGKDKNKGTERVLLSYSDLDDLLTVIESRLPGLPVAGLSRPGPYDNRYVGIWPLEVGLFYKSGEQQPIYCRILCYVGDYEVNEVMSFPGLEQIKFVDPNATLEEPDEVFVIPEQPGGQYIEGAVDVRSHRCKLLLACLACSHGLNTAAAKFGNTKGAFDGFKKMWEESANVFPPGINDGLEVRTVCRLYHISKMLGIGQYATASDSTTTPPRIGPKWWHETETVKTVHTLRKCVISNRNFPVRHPNALAPLESHYSTASLSHVPMINALVFFPPIDKDSLDEPQKVVPKGLALLDTVNNKLPSVSVW